MFTTNDIDQQGLDAVTAQPGTPDPLSLQPTAPVQFSGDAPATTPAPPPATGQQASTAPATGSTTVTTQPPATGQSTQPPAAPATTPLVSLPQELMVEIIKQLLPKELMALRASSTQLKQLVDSTLRDYLDSIKFVTISGMPVNTTSHSIESLLDAWKHQVIMTVDKYQEIVARALRF
jgi:hypothetical protein